MINSRYSALFLVLLLVASCKLAGIKHNQRIAGEVAADFAKAALVERDFESALECTNAPRTSDSTSKLRSLIDTMHPSAAYPVRVFVVSYEPVPGTESMKIYVEGTGSDESYHYLLVMEGTESAGYRVAGIYRSKDPFPASDLIKPLSLSQRLS